MRLINADELKERIAIDSDLVEMCDGAMVPCIDFEYNIDFAPTVDAIPVEWLKNELIPKAEKLGATEYANNIRFVLEDWGAWKRYRGLMERDDKSELFNPETTFDDIIKMVAGKENETNRC